MDKGLPAPQSKRAAELCLVIPGPSQRVRAKRGPMTGSARSPESITPKGTDEMPTERHRDDCGYGFGPGAGAPRPGMTSGAGQTVRGSISGLRCKRKAPDEVRGFRRDQSDPRSEQEVQADPEHVQLGVHGVVRRLLGGWGEEERAAVERGIALGAEVRIQIFGFDRPAGVRRHEGPLDAAARGPSEARPVDAADVALLQGIRDRTAVREVPAEVLGDIDWRHGRTAGAIEQDRTECEAEAAAECRDPFHVDLVDRLIKMA